MLYPSNIPYMETMQRNVALDKGTPPRQGNLVFLFTDTVEKGLRLATQKTNFYANGFVPYYFYPTKFTGYIGKRRYQVRKFKIREGVKLYLEKVPGLRLYPKSTLILPAENKSSYYDLSNYLEAYFTITKKMGASMKVKLFWDTMIPVFQDAYGQLHNKCVLINVADYPELSGSLQERVANPLYLFYYTLYTRLDMVKELDIDFLLFAENRVLRVNFSKCDKRSYEAYRIQLAKLYKVAKIDTVEEKELDADLASGKKEEEEELQKRPPQKKVLVAKTASLRSTKMPKGIQKSRLELKKKSPAKLLVQNITMLDDKASAKHLLSTLGVAADSLEDGVVVDKSEKPNTSEEVDETPTISEEEEETVSDIIEEDTSTVAAIYAELTKGTTPKSQRSSARDELLRKEQENIQVKNMTIGELATINPKERQIPTTDVSSSSESLNPNVKMVKFNNANKAYVEEVMTKDIVNVFENLNDKSIRMFIRDIKVEDSSTVTDLKETWTVMLEDEQRTRHTIKVDIPKFYDKNFLWLGGNRKNIKYQLFFLPLVKISEDTVMVVSNYNKMTMTRIGGRSLVDTTLMGKLVGKNEDVEKYFTKGSATGENIQAITTLEYDEYAKDYIKFRCGSTTIYFSQKEAVEAANKHAVEIPETKLFIGFQEKKAVLLDVNTQTTDDGRNITDVMLSAMGDDAKRKFSTLQKKVPKRVMYTEITTMKQGLPLAILICIWEGFVKLLEKAKIDYRLIEKNPGLRGTTIARDEGVIQFRDCFLIYKRDIPTELLMSGMRALNTEQWALFDMNSIDPYIPYVEKKFGKISILNALNNVYEFTIGKIEHEILTDLKLPTDLVELLLYGNNLLADSQYETELNMNEYRLRSAEIIAAILYDTIAKAYVPYKNSGGKKKLSIPQDAVIKKMLALETVEDTSSLNPFLELETTHGVSTKGWRGVNLDHSYTIPKRSYDDSMRGIIGVSGSPDAQIGVNRTLSMEPAINSVRGYLNVEEDLSKLKDVNMFSPSELLIPLGGRYDDPIRIGHSVKQSRASVPTKHMSPVLMSNGSDEMCKHYLSSDYCVIAEQDGFVIEYDEKALIMIIEYKDGSHQAINLGKNIVKNGGGGFEVSNSLITNLKVGDKFKATETLAWHKEFFKHIPGQGVRMCVGVFVKVALYSLYNTYEDGTCITESVSDKCETEMTFRIKCVLGRNANVFNCVNIGDNISIGQPLVEFDESFEEGDINALLASLGDDEELKDALISNNRNAKKSDKSGVVEEIKIYSASELDDLSPSLRKLVGDYYARIDRKTALLNKYDKSDGILKCGMLVTESSGVTNPNRYGVIRGEKVFDGVLIEFYIKHAEPLEIGSKIANFSPLKNVIGEIIPAGYEPHSEYRPDEHIETVISPSSILARMVGSVYPTIFGNKIIVGLKHSLYDIWTGRGDYATKRKKMETLIYGVFDAMDPTGSNTKKYKELFTPMSENKWRMFFKEFFENDFHYLIFEMVDYEVDVTIENLEKAANVLGIPLYEYVEFPHVTMDKDNPMVTPHRIPVGFIHLKRPQQTVMKKNGMSTGRSRRAGITNQVTGEDKNGRESDLENCMLVSMGLNKTLKELNGPRADDSVSEKEMLQQIQEKGYVQLADLTDDVANKATLNAVDTYFLGMGLKTDLVTKGLKLPKNVEEE